MWLQNRILEPKPRKNNFEAFFGISKAGTSSAPNAKTNLLKLYPGNLEAATALQSAKTELQGTKAQCEPTHKEESPLGDLSYSACAVRTGVEPRATMPASVVASESTCLRTRTSFYPKQDHVSRKFWVTFKSHPWCSSSTGIYARWVTKHNWIATLYSTASSFGAAVPLHKAPQHLQSHQGTSFTVRA